MQSNPASLKSAKALLLSSVGPREHLKTIFKSVFFSLDGKTQGKQCFNTHTVDHPISTVQEAIFSLVPQRNEN